jgi:hypothetical protein
MTDTKFVSGMTLERPQTIVGASRRRISPRRPLKLQICLTTEEKARLAERALAGGYESVSSYVRVRTLGGQRRG